MSNVYRNRLIFVAYAVWDDASPIEYSPTVIEEWKESYQVGDRLTLNLLDTPPGNDISYYQYIVFRVRRTVDILNDEGSEGMTYLVECIKIGEQAIV